jgi:hypothetical protein
MNCSPEIDETEGVKQGGIVQKRLWFDQFARRFNPAGERVAVKLPARVAVFRSLCDNL